MISFFFLVKQINDDDDDDDEKNFNFFCSFLYVPPFKADRY